MSTDIYIKMRCNYCVVLERLTRLSRYVPINLKVHEKMDSKYINHSNFLCQIIKYL